MAGRTSSPSRRAASVWVDALHLSMGDRCDSATSLHQPSSRETTSSEGRADFHHRSHETSGIRPGRESLFRYSPGSLDKLRIHREPCPEVGDAYHPLRSLAAAQNLVAAGGMIKIMPGVTKETNTTEQENDDQGSTGSRDNRLTTDGRGSREADFGRRSPVRHRRS